VPLALSTGHEVGLGVTAAAFIIFALASSFLFPRFRPDYPGRGLLAFVVVAFVFFFGMLAAVETFGAESGKKEAAAPPEATTPAAPQGNTVVVDETEFKITTATTTFKAGQISFEAKNVGKIPHDLAIKHTGDKTKLIQPGGNATLKVTLKAGKYELYCTVPGHEAAGMRLNITVTSSGQPAAAPSPQTSTRAGTTTPPAKPQATKVAVDETEFKITTATTTFKAGGITFEAKNVGKIPHDLAVKQTGQKTKLIQPGGSATLKVTLKAGKYELYCTVPGHEAAGMKLNITVTSGGQPGAAPSSQTSTKAGTTRTTAKPQATKVAVSETEFKIEAASTSFKAGKITFQVKNAGKIPHDLAIKQTGDKTKLIQAGGSAELTVTLKPGTYELYCTVPGHEAAGMKQNITVT
jgi:uncharacterized cupredoxin-like copper-binding protein